MVTASYSDNPQALFQKTIIYKPARVRAWVSKIYARASEHLINRGVDWATDKVKAACVNVLTKYYSTPSQWELMATARMSSSKS